MYSTSTSRNSKSPNPSKSTTASEGTRTLPVSEFFLPLTEPMVAAIRASGVYSNNDRFWAGIPDDVKIAYAKLLITEKNITSRHAFRMKAPAPLTRFFNALPSRWDEVCLFDFRMRGHARPGKPGTPNEYEVRTYDEADSLELMDKKGRGHGNKIYWNSVPEAKIVEYVTWLINTRHAFNRVSLIAAAPTVLHNLIRQKELPEQVTGQFPDYRARPTLVSPSPQPCVRIYAASDSFEMMDEHGRGHGNKSYWHNVPKQKVIDYLNWLIRSRNITAYSDLYAAVPVILQGVIRNQSLLVGADGAVVPHKRSVGVKDPKQQWLTTSAATLVSDAPKPKQASQLAYDRIMKSVQGLDKSLHWGTTTPKQQIELSTLAFESAQYGYPDPLRILLTQHGFPVDAKNDLSQTLLMVAMESRSNKTVELILAFKPDLDICDNCGNRAIMYAFAPGQVAILKQNGANLDAANNDGRTALMAFILDDNADMVKALIAQGADPNRCDNAGHSAYYYAKKCKFDLASCIPRLPNQKTESAILPIAPP